MFKSHFNFIVRVAMSSALLAGLSVYAVADPGPGIAPGPVPAATANPQPQIDLKGFLDRCNHPGAYNLQTQPQDVHLQCTETRLEYVADQPGQVSLPEQEILSASLISDKIEVPAVEKSVELDGKAGSCLRFKQVKHVDTVERLTSCDEVLSLTDGDLSELCNSDGKGGKSGDKTGGKKGGVSQVFETGVVIDSCAALPGKIEPGTPPSKKVQVF